MVLYEIVASVVKVDGYGWHSTQYLPTFYLNAAIQGILDEPQAVAIARRIVPDATHIEATRIVYPR